MENNKLELLNAYTRREHKEDEVYLFDVVLCDNEIDRDREQFSVKALEEIAELFKGKTGIFDHNPASLGQTARIYAAEAERHPEKKNSVGEEYVCVKAHAYMVRTDSNKDLIKEIDAGIKKEVSVSCQSKSRKCSVCGAEVLIKSCRHEKGRTYGGKNCFHILDEIGDAYEWSFVAVPAQPKAGIVKSFFSEERRTREQPSADMNSGESMLYPKRSEDISAYSMKEDFYEAVGNP